MSRILILALLFWCTPSLHASSPFTHSADEIHEIANAPEVWQNFEGCILAIEFVSSSGNGNRYRFKVREMKPVLQPRLMVEGRSLDDGSVITPDNPQWRMVTTQYREEDRYFEATIRPLATEEDFDMSGVSGYVVEDVQDVTDSIREVPPSRMSFRQRISRCWSLLRTGF